MWIAGVVAEVANILYSIKLDIYSGLMPPLGLWNGNLKGEQGGRMVRPKHTKPDKNQQQIVEELRELGYDVDIIAALPGLYDLVVSGKKRLITETDFGRPRGYEPYYPSAPCSVRVEVKSEGGELNDTEKRYCERQKHIGAYIVARSTEDVLKWFGAI